jgi:hypothetical protein
VSKADYALGVADGIKEGERRASADIADTLERHLPNLFYNWANEIGAEIIEIIRLKSGEENG